MVKDFVKRKNSNTCMQKSCKRAMQDKPVKTGLVKYIPTTLLIPLEKAYAVRPI